MARDLLPSGTHRLTLDLARFGLPEVPLIGVHETAAAAPVLDVHAHAGALEICYLVRGEQTFHAGGCDHVLRGNDLFVSFPDEKHGTGTHPFSKGLLYWLQVVPGRRGQTLLTLEPRSADTLRAALLHLPRRSFPGCRSLGDGFAEAFLLAQREPTPLRRVQLAAVVVRWLLAVAECAASAERAAHDEAVARALERIDRHPDWIPRADDLAEAAGLSVSRFKTRFRQAVGMPPGEYVLRRKVALAEDLLTRTDLSITDIAHRLGFSSSQYFATVFRRFTRRAPRELRK